MRKFASTLTNEEIRFARKVEAAGLTSYSQVVKAIERAEVEKIDTWQAALDAK